VTAGAYAFSIEVRRRDGALAGAVDASVSMCVEDALFRAVQAGQLPNDGRMPALCLTPTWHEARRPAVTGLAVTLDGGRPRRYDREVFGSQARGLIQRLVRGGKVAAGEEVTWTVVAREEANEGARPAARTTRAPFTLDPAELPRLPRGGFEVCLDASMLRALRDRICDAGEIERAELLLGRLLHDRERRALELRVVDTLPLAPGRGGSSSTHFAFDPGSFVAARRAAEAREDGVRPVGWHHNHTPCTSCPKARDCEVDWVFFSEADLEVHTSLFSTPGMVALVGGKVGHLPATRPGFRLYGWRDARVAERSFRVEGAGSAAWSAREGTFLDGEEVGRCTSSR
jgi:hypothetical protein